MIFHPNLEYDVHQNLGYDFSSKSRVWMIHQNLEYDFSSKSRVWMIIKIKVWILSRLGMDDHQNLEYDFSSKSRVWMIIKI